MKRMKKLTSIGLVLAMTVGLLAGCSGSGNGEDASTSGGKGREIHWNLRMITVTVIFRR